MVPLCGLLITAVGMMIYMQQRLAEPAQSPDRSAAARAESESTAAPRTPPVQVAAPDLDPNASLQAVAIERLEEFRDHSGTMAAEPFYYLLDLARRSSPTEMLREARSDCSYVQLLDAPDKYRGQLIALRGTLRRLIEVDAATNAAGIHTQYEGWLFTATAGRNPYVVIVADRPIGLPFGADVHAPAEVAGYFLGWWRHSTQNDERTSSPVIIANRFVPLPEPNLRPDAAWSNTYGLAIGIAILVGMTVLIFLAWRSHAPAGIDTPAEPLEFREASRGNSPEGEASTQSAGNGQFAR
jgi:hypothetical protein